MYSHLSAYCKRNKSYSYLKILYHDKFLLPHHPDETKEKKQLSNHNTREVRYNFFRSSGSKLILSGCGQYH